MIPLAEAGPFVRLFHYSGGHHNGPSPCIGAFDRRWPGDRLVGVCMFATPCSENVRAAPFGPEHKDRVTELHRLVLLDECPRNAESMLIATSLRLLQLCKPQIRCVLSFADPAQGHVGTIYQATNWLYTGTSGPAWFYRDPDGRIRHPRQNGHNVTAAEAAQAGWTRFRSPGKHRYVQIVGPRRERAVWGRLLRYQQCEYPKNATEEVAD